MTQNSCIAKVQPSMSDKSWKKKPKRYLHDLQAARQVGEPFLGGQVNQSPLPEAVYSFYTLGIGSPCKFSFLSHVKFKFQSLMIPSLWRCVNSEWDNYQQ